MSIGMYQASVPPLVRTLTNLRHILSKGAAHCEARKIDAAALVGFRLYPDMRPLSFQIQVACDMSKGCVARLSGLEAPKFEDNEQTFAEFDARIEKTLAFIQSASAAQIDGTETKLVVLKTPRGELAFEGLSYVQGFVLPNVYFHVTTAYNILRHNGVELGKFDYLGKP
jgi:uncharacterized protein